LHVGYWADERNCYKWDQSVNLTHSGHRDIAERNVMQRGAGEGLVDVFSTLLAK